jgi:hypothetical protein
MTMTSQESSITEEEYRSTTSTITTMPRKRGKHYRPLGRTAPAPFIIPAILCRLFPRNRNDQENNLQIGCLPVNLFNPAPPPAHKVPKVPKIRNYRARARMASQEKAVVPEPPPKVVLVLVLVETNLNLRRDVGIGE